MNHSFELDIAELESNNFELEEIKEQVAEKITGGTAPGTNGGDYVVRDPLYGNPWLDFDYPHPAIV